METDYHIVPKHFTAGFVEVNRESCMRCHRDTTKHARAHEFGRDWYGRIRGGDNIFSFHPFSLESISDDGRAKTIRMRRELVEGGWLEKYDPAKHSAEVYQIPASR